MFSKKEDPSLHPFSHDKEALKDALAQTREQSLAFLKNRESYRASRKRLGQSDETKQGIDTQRRIWEARKKMVQESILLARLNRLRPNIYGKELLLDIIETLYKWVKEHTDDPTVQKEHIANVRESLENAKFFWKEKTGRKLIIDDSGIFEEEDV